ncbi:hypothetical protein J6590_061325 [Homalodisca vitripennis]|nr:hypothetical protein J6590_061325 [Homalodisca vitripennis]
MEDFVYSTGDMVWKRTRNLTSATDAYVSKEPKGKFAHITYLKRCRYKRRVVANTVVSGVCKPGAKLPYLQRTANSKTAVTALANSFIKELCVRHERVELLDYNAIGRSWFNHHDMHIRVPEKRLLAELLVRSLTKVKQETSAGKPPAAPDAASRESPSPALGTASCESLSPASCVSLSPAAVCCKVGDSPDPPPAVM